MENSVRQQTLSGAKWAAIEKFSVQGIQFGLGIIMARLLMPSDYGIIGMLAIFIAVSQTFIDSGFCNALIRKIDRTEEDFCTVFYFNIVIALTCYLILFVAAPWIANFFHTPILSTILRVQAITLILNSLMGVHYAKLTININFKALAQRTMLASLVSGVVGVVLAYVGWGVWALVTQNLLSTVINLVFIWIYCKWIPRKAFSKESFHELFSYGSKLLASGLLNTVYVNLTPLIIGRFFSSKDLGEYTRGANLAQFPADNINGVLQKVTFPILAKLQNDDEHLISVYQKYICITSMLIFFGCLLLAAIGKPFVHFLLTEKWDSCIIYLQIYCFSVMFQHISTINLNLLQVKGRSDLFLKLEIIKKIISTLILLASIPFGIIGICVSKIIYTQVAVFINCYYTGKLFHLGYWLQVKEFLPYFGIAIVACIPAYLFTLIDIHPVISIAFGCIVSPLLYWWFLRKNYAMKEVVDIVKSKIPYLHKY